jgi:hypothetical protein
MLQSIFIDVFHSTEDFWYDEERSVAGFQHLIVYSGGRNTRNNSGAIPHEFVT